MPILNFTPKSHKIGEETDVFITSSQAGDPVLCVKCNDVAEYIIGQMHPEHRSRQDIITNVVSRFSCTQKEATVAVQEVISGLKGEGGGQNA